MKRPCLRNASTNEYSEGSSPDKKSGKAIRPMKTNHIRMRRYLIVALLFLFSGSLFAKLVDSAEIAQIALSFVELDYKGEEPLRIKSIQPLQKNGEESLVALVVFSPKGWMLVSMDDVAKPVLGYSFDSSFDKESFLENTGLRYVIEGYDREVRELQEKKVDRNPQWEQLKKKVRLKASTTPVAPLIPVEWNQDRRWNAQCPEDPEGPGGHVYVGCVAVAMGQAMTVYKFPLAGVGKKTYSHPVYGVQSVNFDAFGNYSWPTMITNTPNNDIATFLYHLAVTVEMDFGADGSGALTRTAVSALKTYFSYSQSVTSVNRVASDSEWMSTIDNELVQGRPVIYSGDADDGKAGHAFNIDGVSEGGYYHLNWGWSGTNNGYFSINTLTPGSNDFTKNQAAIIGIKPVQAGPFGLSLSKGSVLANLPVGSVVGNIIVEDEYSANTYTYELKGREDVFGGFADPNFYEENGVLKTSKTFEYVDGGTNSDFLKIIVTDVFENSFSKDFYIDILKNTSTFINEQGSYNSAYYDSNSGFIHFDSQSARGKKQIKIYSLSGQLIKSKYNAGTTLNVNDLSPGLYIMTYQVDNKEKYLKFIKN